MRSSNKFSSGPTIRDVALRGGVHKATASAVLSGGPSTTRVSDATRQRILDAAKELRYSPNAVARGLAQGRMNTIGVVMASAELDFESPVGSYVGSVLTGVLEVAVKHGQFVVLFPGSIWSNVRQSLPIYCDGRSDGLLLIAPPENSGITSMLLETHVPFVLIGDQSEDARVTSVDVDNLAAGRSVVAHLIERGHRKIAAVYWSGFPYSVMLRLTGYHEEMDTLGVPNEERMVLSAEFHEDWYHTFRQPIWDLMSRPKEQRPTALFCFNDIIAVSAVRIVREMGLDVPRDVSITGFDGTREAGMQRPPLTTVRQYPRLIGKRAAELLLSQIQDDLVPGSKEFTVAKLVIRGSVGPPPKGDR